MITAQQLLLQLFLEVVQDPVGDTGSPSRKRK